MSDAKTGLAVQTIIVPTDLSKAGHRAVMRGLALADELGAKVHLVHVVVLADVTPVYPMFDLPPDTSELAKDLISERQKALQAYADDLEGDIRPILLQGSSTAPALLRYAEDHHGDLIVMGTHGRRGTRRWLLGSVAEEVVRKSDCPVLTIGPEGDEVGHPERVLAAIDLSDQSEAVLRTASLIGERYDARVDLLHVVPEIHLPTYFDLGVALSSDPRALEENARRQLVEFVDERELATDRLEYHVVSGAPDREITKFAQDHGADLIVIATHGHTGLGYVLLGSVADRVVRTAHCPVLTLPAGPRKEKEEEKEPSEAAAYTLHAVTA